MKTLLFIITQFIFNTNLWAQQIKETNSKKDSKQEYKIVPPESVKVIEKLKTDYDTPNIKKDTLDFANTIEDFLTSFEKYDAEKNITDIKNIQQSIMLLIGQRVLGFEDSKNGLQSKKDGKTYYYALANTLMQASSIYIIEKNAKNAYCAFYKMIKKKN